MDGLTTRQLEVVAFIQRFKKLTDCPPTRQDIANNFGFASPNAAEDHLRALEKKGAVTLVRGRCRGIVVSAWAAAAVAPADA